MLASGATTFLFRKERTVALLWEATTSTLEGTVDGLPTTMLTGAVDASAAAAFVAKGVTKSVVD